MWFWYIRSLTTVYFIPPSCLNPSVRYIAERFFHFQFCLNFKKCYESTVFSDLEKVSFMLWFLKNSIHLTQGVQDVFLMIRSPAYLFPSLSPTTIHPSIHPLYLSVSSVSSTHLYAFIFLPIRAELTPKYFPQFYFIYI